MLRGLFLALLLAASAPLCAHVSVEIGAGITQASPRSNGIWYQRGFPYRLDLQSRAVEINLRWQVSQKVALIAGVVDLGRHSSDSWDTPRDENYSGNPSSPCIGACLPLSHYMGHGGVRGVQLLAGRRMGENWRLEMQGGVLLYQTRWTLDVPDWYPSAGAWSTVGPITPIHTHDQRWAVGGVVGMELSKRGSPWHISLRYYDDGAGFGGHVGIWPPIWRNDVALMLVRTL